MRSSNNNNGSNESNTNLQNLLVRQNNNSTHGTNEVADSIPIDLAEREARNNFIRERRLAYFEPETPGTNATTSSAITSNTESSITGPQNSSTTYDSIITPQEALSSAFFDPTATVSTRSSNMVSIPQERIPDDSFADGFAQELRERLVLNPEQIQAVQDVAARELIVMLNDNVLNINRIPAVAVNRLVDALPYLFNVNNLEITLAAAFGIFQARALHSILMRLVSGNLFIKARHLIIFLRFFRPYILPVTNVLVWARYNFMGGLDSVHRVFVNALNRAVHFMPANIRPLPDFNYGPAFNRIRVASQNALEVIRERARSNWSWFNFFFGATSLSFMTFLIAQIFKNPTAFMSFLDFFLRQFGLFFSKERIAEIINSILSAFRSNPSSPPVFFENVPQSLIEYLNSIFTNHDTSGFDSRLSAMLELMETFFY